MTRKSLDIGDEKGDNGRNDQDIDEQAFKLAEKYDDL